MAPILFRPAPGHECLSREQRQSRAGRERSQDWPESRFCGWNATHLPRPDIPGKRTVLQPKGGKSGSGQDKFTYDLNYLEVPLLIKYKHFVGNQTSIQPYAGGYLAIGTDGSIKNYGSRTAFSSFDDGYFNRFDGGLKLGCGVGFNMLYVDASYDIGLSNIGQDDFNDTQNGCFTINIGVNF